MLRHSSRELPLNESICELSVGVPGLGVRDEDVKSVPRFAHRDDAIPGQVGVAPLGGGVDVELVRCERYGEVGQFFQTVKTIDTENGGGDDDADENGHADDGRQQAIEDSGGDVPTLRVLEKPDHGEDDDENEDAYGDEPFPHEKEIAAQVILLGNRERSAELLHKCNTPLIRMEQLYPTHKSLSQTGIDKKPAGSTPAGKGGLAARRAAGVRRKWFQLRCSASIGVSLLALAAG